MVRQLEQRAEWWCVWKRQLEDKLFSSSAEKGGGAGEIAASGRRDSLFLEAHPPCCDNMGWHLGRLRFYKSTDKLALAMTESPNIGKVVIR
jgi:hypothetical protein